MQDSYNSDLKEQKISQIDSKSMRVIGSSGNLFDKADFFIIQILLSVMLHFGVISHSLNNIRYCIEIAPQQLLS